MILLYILVTFLALYFLYNWMKSSRTKRQLPGPKGLPLIGCALEINEDNIVEKLSEYAIEYGEIFGIKLLNETFVCLNSERLIRKMLACEPYKQIVNNRDKLFFGEAMLFGSQSVGFYGDPYSSEYSAMRKGITRCLHVYGQDGINEFEKRIFKELDRLSQQIESFGGKDFNVVELLQRSLSNVVSLILGGEAISDDDKDVNMIWDFIDGVNYFVRPSVNNLLCAFPFLRHAPGYRSKYKYMLQARDKLFRKYFTDRENRGKDAPRGLVDHMMELQRESKEECQEVIFTDERIKSNILESIVAGANTSLSVLLSTFLCLVNTPEYQEKVFQEIENIIGQTRLPTHADKNECPHLEALELEVHRYMTVLPLLSGRFCTKDVDLDGYHIAKGSSPLANIWYMHHNPKIWGDPWAFRPERFLDDNGKLLPRDHVLRRNWIAFGIGRRQCLGEQFARSRYFLYLATLLRHWKFVGTPGKSGACNPRTGENIDGTLTVRPKPFFCTAEKRQGSERESHRPWRNEAEDNELIKSKV